MAGMKRGEEGVGQGCSWPSRALAPCAEAQATKRGGGGAQKGSRSSDEGSVDPGAQPTPSCYCRPRPLRGLRDRCGQREPGAPERGPSGEPHSPGRQVGGAPPPSP